MARETTAIVQSLENVLCVRYESTYWIHCIRSFIKEYLQQMHYTGVLDT